MKNEGQMVWKDQATAEAVADERRAALVELIDKLRDANTRIDSLELFHIIDAAEADLRVRL